MLVVCHVINHMAYNDTSSYLHYNHTHHTIYHLHHVHATWPSHTSPPSFWGPEQHVKMHHLGLGSVCLKKFDLCHFFRLFSFLLVVSTMPTPSSLHPSSAAQIMHQNMLFGPGICFFFILYFFTDFSIFFQVFFCLIQWCPAPATYPNLNDVFDMVFGPRSFFKIISFIFHLFCLLFRFFFHLFLLSLTKLSPCNLSTPSTAQTMCQNMLFGPRLFVYFIYFDFISGFFHLFLLSSMRPSPCNLPTLSTVQTTCQNALFGPKSLFIDFIFLVFCWFFF